MNISDSWKGFLKNFGKKFQKDLIELARSADNKNLKATKEITGQQYLFVDEAENTLKLPEPLPPLSDFNTKLNTALNTILKKTKVISILSLLNRGFFYENLTK
jgi:hypothetical protein